MEFGSAATFRGTNRDDLKEQKFPPILELTGRLFDARVNVDDRAQAMRARVMPSSPKTIYTRTR